MDTGASAPRNWATGAPLAPGPARARRMDRAGAGLSRTIPGSPMGAPEAPDPRGRQGQPSGACATGLTRQGARERGMEIGARAWERHRLFPSRPPSAVIHAGRARRFGLWPPTLGRCRGLVSWAGALGRCRIRRGRSGPVRRAHAPSDAHKAAASSTSSRSLPRRPTKDRPMGTPSTSASGMDTCGRPARPAVHKRFMARWR